MGPTIRSDSSRVKSNLVNPNEVSSFQVELFKNELEPLSVCYQIISFIVSVSHWRSFVRKVKIILEYVSDSSLTHLGSILDKPIDVVLNSLR